MLRCFLRYPSKCYKPWLLRRHLGCNTKIRSNRDDDEVAKGCNDRKDTSPILLCDLLSGNRYSSSMNNLHAKYKVLPSSPLGSLFVRGRNLGWLKMVRRLFVWLEKELKSSPT